jgi:hypothetical protein
MYFYQYKNPIMQNVEQIYLPDQEYSKLKNVTNDGMPVTEKIKAVETEHIDSDFTLLKRFLKEIQFANNTLLSTYNKEVI